MSIDDKKLWLSCILEEYKYICTESMSAMTKQQSTIQYGLTVIGVSLGLAFNTENSTAQFLVFATLFPLLSSLFYVFYANEFARMVRAGRYLVYIEQNKNRCQAYTVDRLCFSPECPNHALHPMNG